MSSVLHWLSGSCSEAHCLLHMKTTRIIAHMATRMQSTGRANEIAVSSFTANHSLYDQLRPTYQEAIVLSFLADLQISKQSRILELAAGTGKFTQKLIERGYNQIEVVEPSEGMLSTFSNLFPKIKTHLGSSYDIPLADKSVDAILIAQGFHWFSDERSLREMRRVLKDDGKLGLIWNFDGESPALDTEKNASIELLGDFEREGETVREISKALFAKHPWNEKVVQYIYSFDGKVPQYRHGNWRKVFEDSDQFHRISKETFIFYKLPVKYSDVYKYWETRSYITSLPEKERKEIENHVHEILETSVSPSEKLVRGSDTYLEKYMGCHAVVVEPK